MRIWKTSQAHFHADPHPSCGHTTNSQFELDGHQSLHVGRSLGLGAQKAWLPRGVLNQPHPTAGISVWLKVPPYSPTSACRCTLQGLNWWSPFSHQQGGEPWWGTASHGPHGGSAAWIWGHQSRERQGRRELSSRHHTLSSLKPCPQRALHEDQFFMNSTININALTFCEYPKGIDIPKQFPFAGPTLVFSHCPLSRGGTANLFILMVEAPMETAG